ncbi:MAG: putative nuclease of restriction endonuclease-like (RecB) superfamily [Phenylobacterium sp.]|jgi:predicted nuclease of restriction endonuclease-like (RecB) superfamily
MGQYAFHSEKIDRKSHSINKYKVRSRVMNNPPAAQNDLFERIHTLVITARLQVRQTVNTTMVQTYWQIGQLIVEEEQEGEQRAAYGTQQLDSLSKRLTAKFGKGFGVSNLRNMRQFYHLFPIHHTVCSELSWSHIRILMRIKNPQAREWYTQEIIDQNWSCRALERQIGTLYYERLLSSQGGSANKLEVKNEAKEKTQPLALDPKDYLRDPYVLDFLNLPAGAIQESELEQGLINNLQQFLLELGKGFAFVERQQRISTDDGDYYIDLVFYNFHLKCFLLIDLKMHKLSHQDVGQMDMYVRMYEEKKRRQDDNPTIGLILCSEGNETVAKYSVLNDSKQLFSSKYVMELPTEEELRLELTREIKRVQTQLKGI